MKKPVVLFPAAEAGMGHIVPLKAVYEVFTKKYGEEVDAVYTNFFKESKDEDLMYFEEKMAEDVRNYNKHHSLGFFANAVLAMLGTRISSAGTMRARVPQTFKKGVAEMEKYHADVVFSTHWATNYYAQHLEPKPTTVMFCPDVIINKLFRYKCDLLLTGMQPGYDHVIKKKKFNTDNLKKVTFPIRNEAYSISMDKKVNRKLIGAPLDKFTIVFAEGGYGIGAMEAIINNLIKYDLPITIIAVCGKNEELYEKFKTFKVKPKTTFMPMGFVTNMLEVIASADLFCGKSGNIISEPCFFGVPQIVTSCATQIEVNICRYYRDYVKSAIKETNPKKAARLIRYLCTHQNKLKPYIEASKKHHNNYGAEMIADILYEEAMKTLKKENTDNSLESATK